MRRVVITGMGAITPLGNTVADYWENLLNGVSGAGPITRFDAEKFKTKFACEIKGYDPQDYFDRKEARKLDPFAQYGLIAADQAIKNAQIDINQIDSTRAGVIFSSGIGGFDTFEQEVINFEKGGQNPRFNPFFITKIISNGLAGSIAIRHGFNGINYCPVTACASSTQSIVQAFNYIRWNKADIIVAGGSEAPVSAPSIGGFNAMKAMSTNNENYAIASRPFDTERDGFVVGEGAGAIVVESLESAIKRNANIYAEVVGGGESADAYHITGTHPEGFGAHLAMKNAIDEAGIDLTEVNHLNAHATSTGLGDLSEIEAVERLFKDHAKNVHICATKSMTGHLLGGTGAIEAIATTLSVQTDLIPPTINTTNIDPKINPDLKLTLGKKVETPVNYAISNSFGFGGHCAALLLKKYNN